MLNHELCALAALEGGCLPAMRQFAVAARLSSGLVGRIVHTAPMAESLKQPLRTKVRVAALGEWDPASS